MKTTQDGFSALEGILVLLIVVILAAGGWYVWKKQAHTTMPAKSQTATVTKATQPPKAPAGYITYENKDLGFAFSYPKEYGAFTVTSSTDPIAALYMTSGTPSTNYAPGIGGNFSIVQLKPGQLELGTRKYSVEVTLTNGKWITTGEINPADTTNVDGQEYRDFITKQTIQAREAVGGLTVYHFVSGDEGSYNDRFVFLAKGKLTVINLPGFGEEDQNNFGTGKLYDKTAAYDPLVQKVGDSIYGL
ncbi:MAG TPA: hypothetical protein VLF91_05170 [Candidatus Saccharimonadales bacterium]|nr:hypothetical protein [Candidatus Saccharimonadales bacterium]